MEVLKKNGLVAARKIFEHITCGSSKRTMFLGAWNVIIIKFYIVFAIKFTKNFKNRIAEIGDVCGAPVSKCPDGDRTHCGFPMYKGDGYCDDPNNNCGCDWDGGDCCGNNVDTLFCTTCKCLDPNQVAGC